MPNLAVALTMAPKGRSPLRLSDVVRSRPTQSNIKNIVKELRAPHRRNGKNGQTVTVSFTLTPDIDRAIHEMACEMNISRSAVIRQSVATYFERWSRRK